MAEGGVIQLQGYTEAEWLAGDPAVGRPPDPEIPDRQQILVYGANPQDPTSVWIKFGGMHATEPRTLRFSELPFANVGIQGIQGIQGPAPAVSDVADELVANHSVALTGPPGPIGPQRLSTNYIGTPEVGETMESHLLVGGPTDLPVNFTGAQVVIRTDDGLAPDLAFDVLSNGVGIGNFDSALGGFDINGGQPTQVPDNAVLDFVIVRASTNIKQVLMVLEV